MRFDWMLIILIVKWTTNFSHLATEDSLADIAGAVLIDQLLKINIWDFSDCYLLISALHV